MKPGRFLGVAWQHSDSSCCFARAEPEDGSGPQTLVRRIVRSAKELELPANSLKKEVNSNLNLSLDPNLAPNDSDVCKGAAAQTFTAAASAEVDSDAEDLDVNFLTKDDLQEEIINNDKASCAIDDIAPPEVIQSVLNDVDVDHPTVVA